MVKFKAYHKGKAYGFCCEEEETEDSRRTYQTFNLTTEIMGLPLAETGKVDGGVLWAKARRREYQELSSEHIKFKVLDF